MFFTKPLEREVETIPRSTPGAKLAQADAALRRARAENAAALAELGLYLRAHHPERMPWLFGDKLMVPVNLMMAEAPESRRLHSRAAATHRALMDAQAARAEVLRELKIIS
jgi:hypothetical protein